MTYYESLTGLLIKQHDDEKQFVYPKDILEPILCDPISKEWLKDPIIVNGNVYDSNSFRQWIRISNIDPLTGVDISGDVTMYPINPIKYILLCLEEKEDTLLFHSPPNTLLNVYLRTSKMSNLLEVKDNDNIVISYTKDNEEKVQKSFATTSYKKQNEYCDISILPWLRTFKANCDTESIFHIENQTFKSIHFLKTENIKFKNCKFMNCYPEEEIRKSCEDDCSFESDIVYYSLEEYLFTNFISGEFMKPNEVFVGISGVFGFEKDFEIINSHSLDSLSHAKYNLYNTEQFTSAKLFLQSFVDCLEIKEFEKKNPPILFHLYIKSLCDISPFDRKIQVRSNGQRVFERVNELKELLKHEKNIDEAFKKFTSLINSQSCKECGAPTYATNLLMKERIRLGIPFVVDQEQNTYGLDFSLLDLSNKELVGLPLKDYCFAGCDLSHTKFKDCVISHCCFVGATMTATLFQNCTFNHEEPFYKVNYEIPPIFLNSTCEHKPYFDELMKINPLNLH